MGGKGTFQVIIVEMSQKSQYLTSNSHYQQKIIIWRFLFIFTVYGDLKSALTASRVLYNVSNVFRSCNLRCNGRRLS